VNTRELKELFDGLTAERLTELEDLTDSDAPAALIAERLGTLASWQQELRALEAAQAPEAAEQRALWQALFARTTAAFTGWYFGGWSALPDEETNR
jgi:hypothetical protein